MQLVRFSLFIVIILTSTSAVRSQGFGWAGQVWGTGAADINSLQANGSATDADGNIYVVGGFAGTVDFDPGPLVSYLTAVNPAFGGGDAFIIKMSAGGSLIWAKQVGSTAADYARSVTYNPAGYIEIVGDFRGTMDFDPGPGVVNLTPGSTNADIFILRLDLQGNFMNVNRIACSVSNVCYVQRIITDNNGNSIISFHCNNTIDFDPGPAVFNVTTSIGDIVICKYAPGGSLIWAKHMAGSNGLDFASQFAFDHNNNLVVGGTFNNTVDFDPGPGIFNLTSDGASDAFIASYDPSGNLLWAKSFRNSAAISIHGMVTDDAGDVYCTGAFTGSADFDPGPGTFQINAGSFTDAFVVKLESNGNFGWAGNFTISTGSPYGTTTILLDKEGILNITVNFTGTIDADPGTGNTSIISNGDADIALIRLTRNGLYQSSRRIGGTSFEYIANACSDEEGGIFYTGQFAGTTDFDPGPASAILTSESTGGNIFFLKLSGVNYIKGVTFQDNNADGIQQAGEPVMTNVMIKASRSGLDYFGISDSAGHYRIEVDPGTYTITPGLPLYYSSVLPASHSAAFGTITGQTDTANHFGLVRATVINDASVSITNVGPARPGFYVTYRITYENVGTETIAGNIVLTPDPSLSFISAIPTPSPANNWSFSNLATSQSRSIDVVFRVPPGAVIGSFLQLYVNLATTTTDFNPFDNIDSLRHIITGSFDPNDKKVFPDGGISTSFVSNGGYLDYTVRFQNTGTDTAFTVVVKDTLSNNLDISSFKMVSASHPYSVDFKPNSAVEWHFDNIRLPDSNINEPRSHGFVRFKIKPKNTLVAGNQIRNKSAIYFDFNAPVLTNETQNIVTVVTSVTSPGTGPDIKIYPNPAHAFLIIETKGFFDYTITDEAGKKVLGEMRQFNSANVNIASLPKGIYFVKIETKKGFAVRKVLIH